LYPWGVENQAPSARSQSTEGPRLPRGPGEAVSSESCGCTFNSRELDGQAALRLSEGERGEEREQKPRGDEKEHNNGEKPAPALRERPTQEPRRRQTKPGRYA